MTRRLERTARRRAAVVLLVLFLAAVAVNLARADDPRRQRPTVDGHDVDWWANRARANRGLYRAEHHRWQLERAHMLRLRQRVRALQRDTARRLQAHELGTKWDRLIGCEAAGYGWPLLTTGNGYFFAPQFTRSTWDAYRGSLPSVDAYLAAGRPPSREQQIVVAERVLAAQSWEAWPTCARKLGFIR